MKRVVVGLSGGVDSSVAAYLLLEAGYEVIAMFMKNWHDESVTKSDECPWIDDSNDALLVAQHLGIPFQVIDLSKEYKNRIVDYMFSEYEQGRTPNPDVLCNKEIKFDVFLQAALELGAEFVATGHYCQKIQNSDGTYSLKAGRDTNKDQSYFLCQINQEQLTKALFPIGHLEKTKVREIAKKAGLITASKKDSQGLCFVGKISLPIFLQQKLAVKKGLIIEIDETHEQILQYHTLLKTEENPALLTKPYTFKKEDGKVVGEHIGAHFYTIGQRKGLNVGGRPFPSFVISIDIENNIVYTGQKESHLGLHRKYLKLTKESMNLLNEQTENQNIKPRKYLFRIRYRQALQAGTLLVHEKDYYIKFEKLQKGVTPGQFAAWYDNDLHLIGSAVIEH